MNNMYIPKGAIPIDDEYIPKGAVPIDDESQQQSQGILGTVLNAMSPGMGTMTSVLSQNPKSLPSAGIDLLKSVPNAAGQIASGLVSLTGAPLVSQAANTMAQSIPTPSPQTSNALALAGNTALGGAGLEELPNLLAAGGKSLLSKLYSVTGSNAERKANDFVGNLLQGSNFSNAHIPVADEVRQMYSGANENMASKYNSILSDAENRGYSQEVGKQFPGISVSTNQKGIITDNFKNSLKNIDISKVNPDIQDSIDEFIKNPSFNNAHFLQSDLGKEGAALKLSKDGTDRNLGSALLKTRNSLKNDITSTFNKNEDSDLADQYNSLSNEFKNTVAPFYTNNTLRNIVLKNDINQVNPANIGNLLKKNDKSISLIRSNLSDNSKNLLLADAMKGATKEVPINGQMQRITDPKKLIDLFGSTDIKGLNYLQTPQNIQGMQQVQNALSKQNYIKKIGIAFGIAGIGAGGLEGIQQLRKVL